MEEDFDVGAAVDEIGSGLGFDAEPEAKDDGVNLEVSLPTESEEPTPATPAEPAATAPTPATSAEPPADAPPRTWRKEASATWAALPSEAKAEILKREDDIFRGIESYKADATVGQAMRAATAPYESLLQAAGLTPVQAISGLFQTHKVLATGTPEQRLQTLVNMAKSYNVDLSQAAVPAGEPPYIDPAVAALQNELRGVQSQLQEANQRRMQEVRSGITSEVDTFAKDPANPYFNEVATDVAALLQRGLAGTLKEAYEKAIWLNPVTRAKEAVRTTTEANAKVLKDVQETEAKARKAMAANVKARAKSGSATTPLESLDTTLEATLAKIKAR